MALKTWPDILAGKKLLYVHGFASSGLSGTVTLLRELLPQASVVAPDLPLHPEEAMALLRKTCREERPDVIVGSSMGGMMSEMLTGFDRVLVNPAFEMADTMGAHGMIGKLTFQNPRRDGVQEMIVTKAIVKEYKALTARCFAEAGAEGDRVWGLFGDNDPVVHTRPLFLKHYRQAVTFHGEHRLVNTVVHHALIPVLRWIDDRQEGRERETVYIAIDALRTRDGTAAPSMHKAVEALLDNYQVFFVCPAPANATEAYAADVEWLTEHVGPPAFHHVVFTAAPQLLYGDYHIATTPPDGGMATPIAFGSEHFKTWDDITTYFERLRG